MHKEAKWRVGITIMSHDMIDVEADSESIAIEKAAHQLGNNYDDFWTSSNEIVTSVMINDRNSRDYSLFVEDFAPPVWEDNAQ